MFVIPHTNEQQIFLPVTHTTYMWPLISWKCTRPPFFNPLSHVNYFTYKFIVRFMVRDWFGLNFCVPLLALSTCPWLARGQPVPDLLLDTCVAMLWCCLYVCMCVYLEYTREKQPNFFTNQKYAISILVPHSLWVYFITFTVLSLYCQYSLVFLIFMPY